MLNVCFFLKKKIIRYTKSIEETHIFVYCLFLLMVNPVLNFDKYRSNFEYKHDACLSEKTNTLNKQP